MSTQKKPHCLQTCWQFLEVEVGARTHNATTSFGPQETSFLLTGGGGSGRLFWLGIKQENRRVQPWLWWIVTGRMASPYMLWTTRSPPSRSTDCVLHVRFDVRDASQSVILYVLTYLLSLRPKSWNGHQREVRCVLTSILLICVMAVFWDSR